MRTRTREVSSGLAGAQAAKLRAAHRAKRPAATGSGSSPTRMPIGPLGGGGTVRGCRLPPRGRAARRPVALPGAPRLQGHGQIPGARRAVRGGRGLWRGGQRLHRPGADRLQRQGPGRRPPQRGLEVVSDLVLRPLLRKRDLSAEKPVIVDEIRMYEDSPGDHVFTLFDETLFGDHPLGREIAGTPRSVRRAHARERGRPLGSLVPAAPPGAGRGRRRHAMTRCGTTAEAWFEQPTPLAG